MASKAELVEQAKALGIKNAAQMNKSELEVALTPTFNPEPEPSLKAETNEDVSEDRESDKKEIPLRPLSEVLIPQKGVLYTDGLSGPADSNLERAYEIAERLQTSNPAERQSGDESLSEAATEDKTDAENRRADFVKNR